MSIPKTGSTLLHLDGVVYRWRVRNRPTYAQGLQKSGLLLAVELAEPPQGHGTVLVVRLNVPHPSSWLDSPPVAITPVQVVEHVRRALALGWQPSLSGKQFHLDSNEFPNAVPP